jgi:gliding motility-associated-like protein
MKRGNYIWIIALLLLCCGSIQGQYTTQGKDFWLAFGVNNYYPADSLDLQVKVVATKATNVTFIFTELGTSESVKMSAGTVYTRTLSKAEKNAVHSNDNGADNKSLHILSDEKVSVFAINLRRVTTDATGVLPVPSLGMSYYHLSYSPIIMEDEDDGSVYVSADGYVLIATETGTEVYENEVFMCNLDKGGTYFRYFNDDSEMKRHITANKPIAYFTTSQCVEVPIDTLACDCLYEQLLSDDLWGTKFMIPVTIRGVERVRALASTDGTVIRHTGGTLIDNVGKGSLNLNEGEFVELEVSASANGCFIESNNPIAVAAFLTGANYIAKDENEDRTGDPAMTWIPSVEQFIEEIVVAPFVADNSSVITEHHILIITSTGNKNLTEIRISGAPYTSLSGGSWTDHPSGYSYYAMPLTEAYLSYSFKNPKGLLALGYGLGSYESYYYTAGSATRKLEFAVYINDVHYQELETKGFCSGDINVKAVINYETHPDPGHLRWVIDGTEDVALQDVMEWSKESLSGGVHDIYAIVKDKYDEPDTLKTSVTIAERLYINPPQLSNYVPNTNYSQQLTSNVESPTFTLISGTLPNGLNLSASGNLSGFIGEEAENMKYTFTVLVESDNGCAVYKEYTLAQNLSLPRVFSPNGDGINDVFMLGYKVVIFDRLGTEIFRGDNGWDGSHKGKPVPPDIYFYKLIFETADKPKIYTGYVGVML